MTALVCHSDHKTSFVHILDFGVYPKKNHSIIFEFFPTLSLMSKVGRTVGRILDSRDSTLPPVQVAQIFELSQTQIWVRKLSL